jgi:class 3 adenylate cyclase/tetratricopeptide (TPR) repeat protein
VLAGSRGRSKNASMPGEGDRAGLAETCARCGELNPAHSRFCNRCGAELAEAALQEERKLISVLFVDLVDFTARSDRADPEDVRDALQLYHSMAQGCIEEYDGTVEKFIGDAVMAVFGAPVSYGDDAERAVRAGLRVLEGIEELNRAHGLELAARAAVNTGEAIVAAGGGTGEVLAMGDAVNTASRLQTAAPGGRLLVGEATHRATRHAFKYEPHEPVEAKGKSEPLVAWLAIEPSVAPSERPIVTNPLVGRGRELELFRSVWDRAVSERRSHLVTVLGPPGIGKSRLCHEVSSFVASSGGRIVRGRCLPYEEQTGYQAFSMLVKETSGIFESDPPPVAREKLKVAVDGLLPEAEATDTARYLALILGVSGEARAEEVRLLFFAARRFVECLGLVQPTLVVFEDIHWAQPSELELLEYLAAHVRDTAAILVVLARPELLDAHPTWGSGLVAQTTIPLEPLGPADAAQLAAHLLRSAVEASPDVDRLIEVAEGNPLFLEELAASVMEHKDNDLPVTVKAAIAARIDAMPADARSALLGGAVVGKTFWRGVLQSMGGVDDLDEALSTLEQRDLISRDPTSQVAGDVQFTFKHMLIREVAYATLPRAIRRERHAAIAQHIEGALEGSTEQLAWILAHHWREAGEPSKAIPYLLTAAEAAQRGWAKDAAVDLYTKALDLADEDALRRQIRLERGLALVALEDYERASEELGTVLPELEGGERMNALLGLGRAMLWTERDSATIEIGKQAVALAAELDDETALPAAMAVQSQGYAMRGAEGDLDHALELGDRALEEWVPGARQLDRAEHLHLHADCVYWVGRYERCVELSQDARALASDVHSAEALLRGGGTEALGLAGLGRHEEAIRIWDELFAIARDLGRSTAGLLNYSSLAYRELYDLEEARRRSEDALDQAATRTFRMPSSFAKSDLVFTDLLADDVGRAQAAWPEQWEAAGSATGWTQWLIYGRLAAARAEIVLAAESPESAVDWARQTIEITTRTRRRKYEARGRTILGEALARLGRREEALEELRSAVAITDELIGPPARWQARAALGRASYALGDDDGAALAYGEAAKLVEDFADTLAPERSARLLRAPAVEEILTLTGSDRVRS